MRCVVDFAQVPLGKEENLIGVRAFREGEGKLVGRATENVSGDHISLLAQQKANHPQRTNSLRKPLVGLAGLLGLR